jgi:hypothetical protein
MVAMTGMVDVEQQRFDKRPQDILLCCCSCCLIQQPLLNAAADFCSSVGLALHMCMQTCPDALLHAGVLLHTCSALKTTVRYCFSNCGSFVAYVQCCAWSPWRCHSWPVFVNPAYHA